MTDQPKDPHSPVLRRHRDIALTLRWGTKGKNDAPKWILDWVEDGIGNGRAGALYYTAQAIADAEARGTPGARREAWSEGRAAERKDRDLFRDGVRHESVNPLGCTCPTGKPWSPTQPGSAIVVGHQAGCPAIARLASHRATGSWDVAAESTTPKPEIKRWFVSGEVTISIGTFVQARTEKEARKRALAHEMSDSWRDDGDADECWTHDALDGSPKIVSCEEQDE